MSDAERPSSRWRSGSSGRSGSTSSRTRAGSSTSDSKKGTKRRLRKSTEAQNPTRRRTFVWLLVVVGALAAFAAAFLLEWRGAVPKVKVTIPEGFTRFDIAKRLDSQKVAKEDAFLHATTDTVLLRELAIDAESFEGYLFPATYEFAKDTDPREIVRRMKSEFDKRFSTLDQNDHLGRTALESTLGWGRKEIVTLASMVEKEAAVDDERPIIASVLLNRLRDPSFKRRVLQCDPTSGYGCLVLRDQIPSCAGFSGKITPAINTDPLNTYSTYVHEGLPPGPIANPGVKSLQAVLAPADTKYLYFVAREGRRHTFSETLENHNSAVKDLRNRTAK